MRTLTALALILASCSAPQREPEPTTRVYSFDDQIIDGALVKPTPMALVEPRTDAAPDGILLQQAEAYFGVDDLVKAKPLYERVALGEDAALATFAAYKLAWVHYNLGEFTKALESFTALARTRGPDGQPTALAHQALSDTVLAFAEVGLPQHAPGFYQDLIPEDWRKICLRLVELYDIQGKQGAAKTLSDLLD